MTVEQAISDIERIIRELAASGMRIDSVQCEWLDRMDGASHLRSADFDIRKCKGRDENETT